MGGCSCSSLQGDPLNEQDRIISEHIERTKRQQGKVIRILLLGSGECGKSTILKQMKILHCGGFSEEEAMALRPLVLLNTLQSIRALLMACKEFNIDLRSEQSREDMAYIINLDEGALADESVIQRLKIMIPPLWNEDEVQITFSRNNEFTLLDSAPYFLKAVERTFQPKYTPTPQDILRTRKATIGITSMEFHHEGMTFRMFDVGGQRGERKKWIHCFEDVAAIMFITSLSEYDQFLMEDRTRNRMKESLKLFEGIVNLPWFKQTAVILFLNKEDLFKDKVRTADIGTHFPDYKDGLDYDKGLNFIKDSFVSRNACQDKTVYTHVTNATDTKIVQYVWKCTRHLVMLSSLSRSGLLMA